METTDRWLVQVRKGFVELLVLRLLAAKGELHGYALVKQLMSIGDMVAGESTVYPVLRRLEAENLLSSRWVESNGGPPRKYYAITTAGTAFLEDAQREWDTLVEIIRGLGGQDRD